MIANNPIGRTAVKDFLSVMPLTSLEGGVLFGCTGAYRVVSDLRRAGFRIDTRKVFMHLRYAVSTQQHS